MVEGTLTRLTADIFVVRSSEILLLERRGGTSEGFWYIPGGFVEFGEDPAEAAARETYEETGLRIEEPEILRTWCYQLTDERYAYHATYMGLSDDGPVTISHEHSGYRWMKPLAYRDEYLPSAIDLNDPMQVSFYPQLQKNLDLLLRRLASQR